MSKFLWLAALMLLVGCQMKPTEVHQIAGPTQAPVSIPTRVLAQHPIVLDTRAPLEFAVSHLPGAISVVWTDFTAPGSPLKGQLDPDDFALARRMALWGITPETPVLVIGAGPKGHGEEGWVGWLLLSLGVKTVDVGSPTAYRGTIPRDDGPPENKPMWKPVVREGLRLTPEEGKNFLRGMPIHGEPLSRSRRQALGGVPTAALMQRRVVLDVRDQSMRAPLALKSFGWTGVVVEMEWQKFFLENGLPNPDALNLIKAAGIMENDDVLVVSGEGLASGAVTYVLAEAKLGTVHNLVGGLWSVRGRK